MAVWPVVVDEQRKSSRSLSSGASSSTFAYRSSGRSRSRIDTALTVGTKQTSGWRRSTVAPAFSSAAARIRYEPSVPPGAPSSAGNPLVRIVFSAFGKSRFSSATTTSCPSAWVSSFVPG